MAWPSNLSLSARPDGGQARPQGVGKWPAGAPASGRSARTAAAAASRPLSQAAAAGSLFELGAWKRRGWRRPRGWAARVLSPPSRAMDPANANQETATLERQGTYGECGAAFWAERSPASGSRPPRDARSGLAQPNSLGCATAAGGGLALAQRLSSALPAALRAPHRLSTWLSS